jgi:hypothetical protein
MVLLLAAALLILGETVLKGRLGAVTFLLYWLLCLALTGAAIVIALIDLRAQRQGARQERRELLETTLKDIEVQALTRAKTPKSRAGSDNTSAPDRRE